MWLHYYVCLALLMEFTDGKISLTKFSPNLFAMKKQDKDSSKNEVIEEKEKQTAPKGKEVKPVAGSTDAPWCQDHIDDCDNFEDAGYCNDIYGKYYHLCEKTCTKGTCKSPFL